MCCLEVDLFSSLLKSISFFLVVTKSTRPHSPRGKIFLCAARKYIFVSSLLESISLLFVFTKNITLTSCQKFIFASLLLENISFLTLRISFFFAARSISFLLVVNKQVILLLLGSVSFFLLWHGFLTALQKAVRCQNRCRIIFHISAVLLESRAFLFTTRKNIFLYTRSHQDYHSYALSGRISLFFASRNISSYLFVTRNSREAPREEYHSYAPLRSTV